MVASRIGSASSPPFTIRPSTPTEKSPDTGFTPEWSPAIDVTNRPCSTAPSTSSWVPVPGRDRQRARRPRPGVVDSPRLAEPVDAVPERRPV